MKRKKIGIITICVLLFLGAMIFIVIRNGQRKDKEAIVEDTEKEQYLSLIHISEPTRQLASSRMPSSA